MKIIDRLFLTFMFFGVGHSLGELLGFPPTSVLELVVGMLCFFGLWQFLAYAEESCRKGKGD